MRSPLVDLLWRQICAHRVLCTCLCACTSVLHRRQSSSRPTSMICFTPHAKQLFRCRYVVRQGQGGRQATQDKSGKFAKSAGSSLRRHNEAALERDISDALTAWQALLASCDLIFVHAPSANRKAVLGSDAGHINPDDPRVRRVPFSTRRPTFNVCPALFRFVPFAHACQRCLAMLPGRGCCSRVEMGISVPFSRQDASSASRSHLQS